MRRYSIDQIAQISTGSGKDNCSEEINENDETHTEAAEATEIFQKDQFGQVMDRGVDPSAPLREKNTPRLWSGGTSIRVWYEFVGHLRKVFGHECRKVAIFSKRKEILFVQCVHVTNIIVVDDFVGYDQGPTFI